MSKNEAASGFFRRYAAAVTRDLNMTITFEIESIEDATYLTDEAQLNGPWFPVGCGDGFAHWLYLNRKRTDPNDMSHDVADYLSEWASCFRVGIDLDIETRGLVASEKATVRRLKAAGSAMAQVIETAKCTREGRAALQVLRVLATSAGQRLGERKVSANALVKLAEVLKKLAKIASVVPEGWQEEYRSRYWNPQPRDKRAWTLLEQALRLTPPHHAKLPHISVALCVAVALDSEVPLRVEAALIAARMRKLIARESRTNGETSRSESSPRRARHV